jgi:hypothetical protein
VALFDLPANIKELDRGLKGSIWLSSVMGIEKLKTLLDNHEATAVVKAEPKARFKLLIVNCQL